jgi:S1-C subfamily serine protease
VVIEGHRILTNAHVVLYATEVQIQVGEAAERLNARVEFLAPGIDLAVLRLEDETFFTSHPVLPRAADIPAVKTTVLAYGFPNGGNGLSVTKGIVSRLEYAGYNNGVHGLRMQIDAAINPGNSGGPVLVGDRMIGVAVSYLGGAQNISYIIPVEEVELFLHDIEDGRYDGKPALFDSFQRVEHPALRAHLGLGAEGGVLVRRPADDIAGNPLKAWDVVTQIGGNPLDNEGMVKLPGGLRVDFRLLVQRLAKDGQVALTVRRDGGELTLAVPVPAKRPRLVPDLDGKYPPYFVYGPYVFSSVSNQFVATILGAVSGPKPAGQGASRLITAQMVNGNPLVTRLSEPPTVAGEELVFVCSPPLSHPLARGYGSRALQVVESVNGQKIRNLEHFVEVLRDSTEVDTVIQFAGQGTDLLVLPHHAVLEATAGILDDNSIRAQASPELLALWNAK